jgi:type I restriction enzyme M protein
LLPCGQSGDSRVEGTATGEEEIDLNATHTTLKGIEEAIQTAKQKHNKFLKELGLPLLP